MSSKRKAEDTEEEFPNKQTKNDEQEDNLTKDNGSESVSNHIDTSVSAEKSAREADDCGILLICGSTNWDLTGRKVPPKGTKGNQGRNLWSPHRLAALNDVRVRMVVSGCTSVHSIIVTKDGKAMSFGRNEKGQLGHGDTKRRDTPTLIEALKDYNVVGAACGRNHTLILTDKGIVYAFGDNKFGQCGVGNPQQVLTPVKINYDGPPIVKVACGADFSMILDCKGGLHSFGCPEYGQLGHNTDGKYFVTSTKLGFNCETAPKRVTFFIEKGKDGHIIPVDVIEIVDFACGANHTVAIDSKKRVFSWGFGGYGRLGHAEQKDEMVPRLIKFFDTHSRGGGGVKAVYCGTSFSLALNEYGALYLFGQTKRTGDANMYPKPIQDLAGWNIRTIGCSNTSIVIAADDSVIAWGPSPTYGELGHGELRKSSTVPLEVKPLEDFYIMQVACGMGHTLFIARDHSEEEYANLQNLPEYSL